MVELTVEAKLKALERIVKSLTYAEKIIYQGKGPSWVEFHGVDPESFSLRGYSEGLDLDWSAEPYERKGFTVIGEGAKAWDAHMVATIWLSEDPWIKIDELEAQIHSSKQEAGGLMGKDFREGWTVKSGPVATPWHYFREGEKRSVCGSWIRYGAGILASVTGVGRGGYCKSCLKIYEKKLSDKEAS